MPKVEHLSSHLARIYQAACLAEVEALKPGNVHIFADGHGMTVQDFMHSAEVSASLIACPHLGLGKRIFRSVEATRDAVGCNTNLGIILLCAPMIQAALLPQTATLMQRLLNVLQNTTQADAEFLFKAIQMANPAGLGQAEKHDVHQASDCTLLAAMQAAAHKDLIGLQYANGFGQIWQEGLPRYQAALARWERPAWAATSLYLYWLSHYPDSHIARKYGITVALKIQDEMRLHDQAFLALENPKHYFSRLLELDQSLKRRLINPGTSADLTVVTIFAHHCCHLLAR